MNLKLKFTAKKLYFFILDLCIINAWFSEMNLISPYYLSVKSYVLAFIVICAFIEVFVSRFKPMQMMTTFSLLILSIYSYSQSAIAWVFYLFFAILFAWHIDKTEEYINHIYNIYIIILYTNIGTFLVQYIFARSTLAVVTTRNMLRYDMNFSSAGDASKFWCFFAMLVLLKYGHYSRKQILWLCTGGAVFYYFCRAEIILMIPLLIMADYMKNIKIIERVVNFLCKWSFPILTIFTIMSLALLNTRIMSLIDTFLTGRLSMGMHAYSIYSYTIFGQNIENSIWFRNSNGISTFMFADNSFLHFIICYGVIFILPIAFIIFSVNKYLNYSQKISIILFTMTGLLNSSMISPLGTFPIVIACSYLYSRDTKNKTKFYNVL